MTPVATMGHRLATRTMRIAGRSTAAMTQDTIATQNTGSRTQYSAAWPLSAGMKTPAVSTASESATIGPADRYLRAPANNAYWREIAKSAPARSVSAHVEVK